MIKKGLNKIISGKVISDEW